VARRKTTRKRRKKATPSPNKKSSAKGTSKLPKSAFAYPSKRKYPINTVKRARNALARAKQSHTFGSYSHVARAVKRRYGSKVASVGGPRGTTSRPGLRKSTRKK